MALARPTRAMIPGITDHSASFGFGTRFAGRLRERIPDPALAGTTRPRDHPLAGSEVNILPDGSLDYDDETLTELDWVVAPCTPPSR